MPCLQIPGQAPILEEVFLCPLRSNHQLGPMLGIENWGRCHWSCLQDHDMLKKKDCPSCMTAPRVYIAVAQSGQEWWTVLCKCTGEGRSSFWMNGRGESQLEKHFRNACKLCTRSIKILKPLVVRLLELAGVAPD